MADCSFSLKSGLSRNGSSHACFPNIKRPCLIGERASCFADIILVTHFLFVLFVVGSLPLIWIGARMRARFVRNLRVRVAHLARILFVALESLVGMVCPFTWTGRFAAARANRKRTSFSAGCTGFFSTTSPKGVLTVIYLMFPSSSPHTFKLVPPHRAAGSEPIAKTVSMIMTSFCSA